MNVLYLDATRSLYGASRMLLTLLERADSLGVRPYVVLANDVEDDMRFSRELDRLNVRYWEHPVTVLRRQKYLNPRGVLHLSVSLVKSVGFLRRLIRRYRIDLVQTNTSTILSGAVAARLEGVPHVWHVHELFKRVEGRVLTRLIHARSWRAVVPSEAVATNLAQSYP
ncbi:MAG TPA: glycosyltransferase, partial [Chloroflexia bacterium]|nr:glycosyltransferase [Chloroflexia bacterium]